ncbi:MAG: ATP-dependent zinc metalloprotease FtsH [Victivallaceae bacterium]|nr:ATP-dependent zinc metalloprotease FtsH [Victivallaceae bacterium]
MSKEKQGAEPDKTADNYDPKSMKDQKVEKEQKSDTPAGDQPPPRKSSKAGLVWLIIFFIITILAVYKFQGGGVSKTFSQNKFEKYLADDRIITAVVSSETDRVLYVTGKFKLSLEEQQQQKIKDGSKAKKIGIYTTRVIFSEQFNQQLQSKCPKVIIKPKENWWSLLATVLPALLIIGLIYFLFSRQIKMAGKGAMSFGKSKARMIMPSDLKISFDDVAGADEAKEETKEIIDFLKDPLKFKLLGGRIPKGALLMGAPGTGKTLLAKAVASEANVPFFSISGSDFVEMFVGVGASRVRDMFEQARRHSPCLIFIDEIDAVGRSRFSGMGGGHDEREQTLNAMLVEMDGLETQSGVIVLAATNRPDVLDPALLRPGRFDRQIVLDLPDIKGRRQILDVHVKTIRVAEKVDLDVIAKSTVGFSGADIANLCNEAALLAARNDKEAAEQDDFEEARDKVRWGRERKSRKITEKERKLTAYHEAGHTLVSINCTNVDPLHKVTIIPRGRAYLGATMTMPKEDSYTQSKNELLDQLAVLMGGRAAEELVFKDVTSGASSDIEQSSKIARLMICTFGMNDKIGPVQYRPYHEQIHVRADALPAETYSNETAQTIDREVQLLIENSYKRAMDILTTQYDKLEKLSQALLDKETLNADEIYKLLDLAPPV